MLLIENYHGIADCFAVCEQGQATSGNMVVFRVSKEHTTNRQSDTQTLHNQIDLV